MGGRGAYEDNDVEQGVCTESVGAVDTDTCCFSRGVEAVYNDILAILDIEDLPVVVCRNAAHAVVHCWYDGNRLFGDIDTRENTRCLGNTR